MQSDPVGLEGGENSFVYVSGNPLVRVDEDGQFWWLVARGVYVAARIGYKLYKKAPCLRYRLIDCTGVVVYIGISKTPHLRMYGHRSRYGVIGKYGCEDCCPITMEVVKAFKNRKKCLDSEKRAIMRYKPIWNTIYNNDPYKSYKRELWKKEHCW